jgi:hypothetical protein
MTNAAGATGALSLVALASSEGTMRGPGRPINKLYHLYPDEDYNPLEVDDELEELERKVPAACPKNLNLLEYCHAYTLEQKQRRNNE